MLDDIRNSTLLIMVCAVAMAVAVIALQPEPHREAATARKPAGPPALRVSRTAGAAACEAPAAKPDAVLKLAAN